MIIDSFDSDLWQRRSWVDSANDPSNGFPLQSLPFCSFVAENGLQRIGVGIGDYVVDLRAAATTELLDLASPAIRRACDAPHLNALMRQGWQEWYSLRSQLMHLLDERATSSVQAAIRTMLHPRVAVGFRRPVRVGGFTDFYASREHATNVGRLFRPERPLLPNYSHLPIAYNGRASSVVVSGTDVRRPRGQRLPEGGDLPIFAATDQLDYELELGAYVGEGNRLGEAVAVDDAWDHIFGFTLLNDWSARDIQSWEYQPLGPFLGKSFATSVSPWVVPAMALEAFRVSARRRDDEEPPLLPYLAESEAVKNSLNVVLEVWLSTERMRGQQEPPVLLCQSNAEGLAWSWSQMIAHHTSNECNLQVGDLLGSGTVSGSAPGSEGCLLERTKRGAEPITLPNGETRTFLHDGDEVILRGFCEREGLPRISFGECRGTVLPAR